jgi:hypothetical protein
MSVFLEIMRPIRTRRMSAVSQRRGQMSSAIPIALQVRKFRRAATRMTVSIGAAALVVTAPVVPASASSSHVPPPDKTALIMGFTSLPTPDDFYIDAVKNQFIAPTHPGQTIDYVAVTTPEEGWPLTGLVRLTCAALGPPSLCGPGGAAWPDEPWWKLSGLFDLTFDQSVQAGVADLETAMAVHGNDRLVIYGYSQGATVAIREKRKLAAQYPWGTKAPDIDFVLGGDGNLPNGGLLARFPGLYIPILDLSFNGPEPTDTQFDTVVITRQYDFYADFPLYPLNLVADLNAFLGFWYVHLYAFDVSLAPDPSTSPPIKTQYGDTTYYFFETRDLPLFGPLRTLGVPEPVIDVVEPFFRVIVELGYDRSIPSGEPTPARLIPTLDPATVTADLVNAIGEGINNAAALFGSPAPLNIPAAPATADQDAAVEQVLAAPSTALKSVSRDVADGVSRVLTAVGSQPPAPPAVTPDNLETSPPTVRGELAATRDQINETTSALKPVIGNGRTIVRSARGDNDSNPATASPTRKTPVRDAVTRASSDVNRAVTKVSDSIQTARSGGKDDDNDEDGREGGARSMKSSVSSPGSPRTSARPDS